MIKPLLPIVKWAGGKRWLAPRLLELYAPHRHRRLVEPFCGGLSIALGLHPDRALINDINKDLIGLYRSIRCNEDFEAADVPNTEDDYYFVRNRFNQNKDAEQVYRRSQDFYYLNLSGFNGLCRYNSQGKFNVPYGKRKRLSTIEDFRPYHEAFKGFEFENGSYAHLSIEDNDFVIVDPPYDAGFTSYSGNTFGWEQQIELADWLDRIPKVPQVACNLATDRIVQLYTDRGWSIELVEAPRSISCDGNRKKAIEMLATRYFQETAGVPRSTCTQVSGGRNASE